MSHVFVGTNFRFGRKRVGDYKFLHSFGKKKGFIVKPIKLIKTPSTISKNTKIKIFSSSNIFKFSNNLIDKKINLGLYLQGGSYLLLEIDNTHVIEQKLQNLTITIINYFKEKKNQIK